jgi:hypothetical protein
MIITCLKGGIGNQLFQYAAGRALADQHGVVLKLDCSAFEGDPLRVYALNDFSITASLASPQEISSITGSKHPKWLRKVLQAVEEMKPYYRRRIYNEPHFHFDKNFFKAPARIYLDGYWQSECYFHNIVSILHKEFMVNHPQQGKNAQFASISSGANSVSIHIRRGDYINNPGTNEHHGFCSPAYYSRCIEWIARHIEKPYFFVFSDDIAWAKAHLPTHEHFIFVDHNTEKNAYEDLRLMSQCKHHIIANSTFSWWGAWLGSYQDKKVLAPSPWFNAAQHSTADLIPEGWILIEAR